MLRSVLVSAPIALILAGCGSDRGFNSGGPEYGAPYAPPVEDEVQEDRIVQVTTPMVDVLWTIDNSCSMADEQNALADAFPEFMHYFLDSGLDYHIGVTSTDIDGDYNGSKGKLVRVGDAIFIDVDSDDPMGLYRQMASLGTNGWYEEKGIGATYLALEERRDTDNAGFYRDEAAMHTIVISDEPDFTETITQPEFVDWYDNLKPESDMRSFSAIVDFQYGTEYKNSAIQIGGIVWDIHTADWPQLLERLGIQAAGLKREYFLSQLPVPGTLEVAVDEVTGGHVLFVECPTEPVTTSAATTELPELDCGYTYDGFRNSITFLTYIPEPLSTVILTYTLLASQSHQSDLLDP